MTPKEQMQIMNTALCRINSMYCEWAKKNGIGYNKMMTLYALNHSKETTQKEICDGWILPKQTVNTIVKNLEKLGYVAMKKGKGNSKTIFLTDEGEKYTNEILGKLNSAEEKVLENMSEDMRMKFFEAYVEYERVFNKVMTEEIENG